MKQKVMQGTDLLYKRASTFIFITALSFVAFPLYAGEIKWTGGGQTASMSDGDNWGGTVPGASDTAVVYGNTAAVPAITPDGGATYAGLWVSNYGDGYVLQTNGVVTVTGNDGLRIGRCSGYIGHYTVTNGTLKATTGTMYVGCYGATGVLKVSGDGIVEAPNFSLAVKGPSHAATKTEAYLDVSEDARVCVAGSLTVGYETGGNGYCAEVRQSGGVVQDLPPRQRGQGGQVHPDWRDKRCFNQGVHRGTGWKRRNLYVGRRCVLCDESPQHRRT